MLAFATRRHEWSRGGRLDGRRHLRRESLGGQLPPLRERFERYGEDGFATPATAPPRAGRTQRGYLQRIAVAQKFVLKMRNLKAELSAIAPLFTEMVVLP